MHDELKNVTIVKEKVNVLDPFKTAEEKLRDKTSGQYHNFHS